MTGYDTSEPIVDQNLPTSLLEYISSESQNSWVFKKISNINKRSLQAMLDSI